MSTFKGKDDCTDMILDQLASAIESGGNYNAVIGNARASDDLGLLSLAQIYELMERLVARGEPSSAIGRYQIIRATLENLQDELQLPDNTLFTPVLQDGLAVQLMVGRGYRSWWRDEINDASFAHGLSCEWASLPDPRKGGVGTSHYAGVGSNRAGMTLAHVYGVLKAARTVRDAQNPKPSNTASV
jgi:conjugal transfer mating pair stabilization protein TraG